MAHYVTAIYDDRRDRPPCLSLVFPRLETTPPYPLLNRG